MKTSRYHRQMIVSGVGKDGQKVIAAASVLIVGCGALGSIAAMYLAGAGVGKITLMDFDTVALSNLHRQIFFAEKEENTPKAFALAEKIRQLNSEITVEVFNRAFTEVFPENLREFSLILGCTDSAKSKILIARRGIENDVPCVIGSVESWTSQVALLLPGNKNALEIYTDIMAAPENGATGGTIPVMGPTPGVTGSLQAAEAIKLLTAHESSNQSYFIHRDLQANTQYCLKL